MKISKRITIASINGVRKGFKDVKTRRKVARIFGIARESVLKVSETMKNSYAFGGEFKAINEAGEEFIAAVCYMPEPAQGLLHNAVEGAKGSPVEFGFDFYIVPNESAVLGYEFETESLMEHRASSALAEIESRVAQPALTHDKPKAEAAKPAPAPAKPAKR